MTLEKAEIITELKPHSRKIRTYAELIREKVINNTFVDEAPKRTYEEWVTIDSKNSEDLDDWIWAYETKKWYCIIWSIADVSEYIKPYSLIDLDAASRALTIYDKKNYDYHMLPREIWIDICSLGDRLTKKTQSTKIFLDKDFKITSYKRYESEFHNLKRFDYDEFHKQFNNDWEDFHKQLKLFLKIAKWMHQNREFKENKDKYNEKVAIKLWKKSSNNISDNDPNFIIREFMIAINTVNARYNSDNKINWIYRRDSTIIESTNWFITEKRKAFNSHKGWKHLWTKEDLYGQFTSPIRRFIDIVNTRLQKNNIRKQKATYTTEDIKKIIFKNNLAITNILSVVKEHRHNIWNKKTTRSNRKL